MHLVMDRCMLTSSKVAARSLSLHSIMVVAVVRSSEITLTEICSLDRAQKHETPNLSRRRKENMAMRRVRQECETMMSQ